MQIDALLLQFHTLTQHAWSQQQNTQHPDEFQINGLIGTSWQMQI
jgi:hypothetical protein